MIRVEANSSLPPNVTLASPAHRSTGDLTHWIASKIGSVHLECDTVDTQKWMNVMKRVLESAGVKVDTEEREIVNGHRPNTRMGRMFDSCENRTVMEQQSSTAVISQRFWDYYLQTKRNYFIDADLFLPLISNLGEEQAEIDDIVVTQMERINLLLSKDRLIILHWRHTKGENKEQNFPNDDYETLKEILSKYGGVFTITVEGRTQRTPEYEDVYKTFQQVILHTISLCC